PGRMRGPDHRPQPDARRAPPPAGQALSGVGVNCPAATGGSAEITPMSLLSHERTYRPPPHDFKIRTFRHVNYLRATRHPWPCLLFLLPLLAAYEIGIVCVGGTQADALRNGADSWLRWAVEAFGLHQLYIVPGILALVFVVWSLLRLDDRPDDTSSVCLGMAIESLGFGL